MARNHNTPSAQNGAHHSTIPNGAPFDGGAQTFTFSRFKGKFDNTPELLELTWREIVDLTKNRRVTRGESDAAKDGALICGARYPELVWRREGKTLEEVRNPKNETPEDWRPAVRGLPFVQAISIGLFEFDGNITQDELKRAIRKLNNGEGAAAIIYSTFSHGPGKNAFRVLIGFARELSPEEWPTVWTQLYLAFNKKPDPKCKDASRMHYLPACPESRKRYAVFLEMEGPLLDVATLPPLPQEEEPEPFEAPKTQGNDSYARKMFENELGRLVATTSSRNDTLNKTARRLGGLVGAKRLDRSEVEEGLFNASRSNGYVAKDGETAARRTIKSGLDAGEREPNYKGLPAPSGAAGAALIRGRKPAQGTAKEGKSEDAAEGESPQASEIPAPALRTDRGMLEYEAGQLVKILRPSWECVSLASHAAHADRIVEHVGDNVRYSQNLGWVSCNGRNWERDDRHATQTTDRVKSLSQIVRDEGAALYELAGELARQGRGADSEAMGRAATQHLKFAKQTESKSFLEGALHFAAGSEFLRVTPDVFDQRPWLLGFKNGVWCKGEWRKHRREDFLLHLCPVEYDAAADRREWEMVLNCITNNDHDFALMLQDVAGYVLSGASHLRLIPWLYGPKGTGKSTYTELLQTVLGGMSATIDPKKLHNEAARERLGADLWNKRGAFCAEAGSQRLEAELLKTLSGGDTITVRFLYQEAFDAHPRHVLLMVANDAPKLDAYDDALKDRVVALPFVHRLDANGPLKLTGGARIEAVRKETDSPLVRGFTAWALEGLARVYETQSVHRAACTEEATAKFWADTDPLTPFWETIDESDLREGIKNGILRLDYEKWCENEGLRPFKGKAWAKACESRGLTQELRGSAKERARVWVLRKKQPTIPFCEQNEQIQGKFSKTYREDLGPYADFSEKTTESVHSVHNGPYVTADEELI